MNTIEEYATLGESHDVMDALILLTQAYISQCGISLGNRTIVYDAAEAWLEQFVNSFFRYLYISLQKIIEGKPSLRAVYNLYEGYMPLFLVVIIKK